MSCHSRADGAAGGHGDRSPDSEPEACSRAGQCEQRLTSGAPRGSCCAERTVENFHKSVPCRWAEQDLCDSDPTSQLGALLRGVSHSVHKHRGYRRMQRQRHMNRRAEPHARPRRLGRARTSRARPALFSAFEPAHGRVECRTCERGRRVCAQRVTRSGYAAEAVGVQPRHRGVDNGRLRVGHVTNLPMQCVL